MSKAPASNIWIIHSQPIIPHDLLGQLTVETVKPVQAGSKRRHHLVTGTLLLLPAHIGSPNFWRPLEGRRTAFSLPL